MKNKTIEEKKNYWESIEEADKEVKTWSPWKRNLSGLKSNYCLELQTTETKSREKAGRN
ncbi:hypothetical protein KAR34_12210 [bacterium]|nr:hypothetical protein [bacterium]